jgi:hypothetical protein
MYASVEAGNGSWCPGDTASEIWGRIFRTVTVTAAGIMVVRV